MENLRCPSCGCESIMTTKRSISGSTCVCRECFTKGDEYKFIEAYEIAHDQDHEN